MVFSFTRSPKIVFSKRLTNIYILQQKARKKNTYKDVSIFTVCLSVCTLFLDLIFIKQSGIIPNSEAPTLPETGLFENKRRNTRPEKIVFIP
jgi:hypothetical protein